MEGLTDSLEGYPRAGDPTGQSRRGHGILARITLRNSRKNAAGSSARDYDSTSRRSPIRRSATASSTMDLPTCRACGQSVLDDDAEDCPFLRRLDEDGAAREETGRRVGRKSVGHEIARKAGRRPRRRSLRKRESRPPKPVAAAPKPSSASGRAAPPMGLDDDDDLGPPPPATIRSRPTGRPWLPPFSFARPPRGGCR